MKATSSFVIRVALGLLAVCVPRAARAQELNENCTVSVLNRNVQVKPDGSWVLPNIPANFGPVRARVTCIIDGLTVSGESEPFVVPPNGAVNVPRIVFGQTTPIPTTVTIDASTRTLTQIGATVQLAVTGHYPGGTTRDISAASSGTRYTISNAAIATVSADGLAQALKGGTVLIQATQEGSAGMIAIRVAFSNADTDGDGIPDEWELAHGLDPNSALDAQEDPDHDGLTNLQEYHLGTDPHKADTDGDGLIDGDEVNIHHTDPLLRDTDGDGISDGLEVRTGSDPLDPDSRNLNRALARIRVTPGHFVLTFNTIAGDVSRPLTVTGDLLDGTTIDLTPTTRGTNYDTSDITICSFSADSGRVFAGMSGSCTITVTSSGFTATSTGEIRTFTPTALSAIDIPGFANNVAVNGDFAYVAAGGAGLQILDVSDRTAPRIVASLDTPGNANDVKVAGSRAYVADGRAGLQIIDITNPLAPRLLGSLDTPGDVRDVWVAGDLVFVAAGSTGVQIIDASVVDALRLIISLRMPGSANGVAVSGNFALVAVDDASLQVVDVTDLAHPAIVGAVGLPDLPKDVVAKGTIAYVADASGSLQVVDFSEPTAPVVAGTTDPTLVGELVDVAVADRFAAGADVSFVSSVTIVDVQTPSNPIPRAVISFLTLGFGHGTGITLDGNFVYLTASPDGGENGTTGDTRLYIGQYRAIEDLNDVSPTATITSPVADATFLVGESISVAVAAADDVGVAAVDIRVGGVTVFHDTSDPFDFSATVPDGITSLVIGASAIDFGNNLTAASDVRVNVLPDPLTTVVGRVVDANGQPLAGASVRLQIFTVTTGPDGRFSIDGVRSAPRSLVVSATIRVNGTEIVGTSAPITPARGGTTDVGDVVAVSSGFVSDLGTRSSECTFPSHNCSFTVSLPFDFTIGGNTYRQMHVLSGGSVEFDGGDALDVLWWRNLIVDTTDASSGVYINDTLPDRLVVTWYRLVQGLESFEDTIFLGPSPQPVDTFQLSLFADGLIQFAYRGVGTDSGRVGVLPANPLVSTAVDFSAHVSSNIADGEAMYEDFVQGNNPFDLGGAVISFTPSPSGGYDLRLVSDTVSPVCNVAGPLNGSTVIEGESVLVAATASDNTDIKRVKFESSGGGAGIDVALSPYSASFVMPLSDGPVLFTVTAFDGAGNTAVCTSTATVIPDPLTTVVGRVLAIDPLDGSAQPVAGATVTVLGRTATTGPDGEFSIAGVPTLHPVRATSTFNRGAGTLTGLSALVSPTRGGITNVGDQTVMLTAFESDFGTFFGACLDCDYTLPFEFPSAGRLWDHVVVDEFGIIRLGRRGEDGPQIAPYDGFIEADSRDPASGVYVNRLPGRFVVTWLRETEWSIYFFPVPPYESRIRNPNPITMQLILFSDGRIQFGYRGVAGWGNLGETVGLFPVGASVTRREVDFSADQSLSVGPDEAIFEFFGFSHPVDLDNSFLVFTPDGTGGYDIRMIPDDAPPVCEVVNPPNGATLFGGESLFVEARASDNMIVERVTIQSSAGGLHLDTTKAPYRTPFMVPVGSGQITFDVSARDRAGNIGFCSATAAVVTGPPPTVAIALPASGVTIVAGATVRIPINAVNRVPVVSADLVVNGVPIATTTAPPFDTLLTVPSGVSALTLSVSALDAGGQTGASPAVIVSVVADPRTTIQGRVVDESAAPVAGAQVTAVVHGVSAEIFNFDASLSSLPNLTSRTPDLVTVFSAVNLRNPDLLFGVDPFGFGQSPSRAVRFATNLQTVAAGTYRFTLGVHGGGRLIVNGVTVVDVPIGTDGLFHQESGTTALGAGSIPIQILTFDNGNPEVQLSYMPPGDGQQVVPPNMLVPGAIPYQTASGADGTFTMANVPTALGDLGATATFTTSGGTLLTGTTALVPPVGGGTTDVGDVIVSSTPVDPELGTRAAACDYCTVVATLPFAFEAFGNSYQDVNISSRGHVWFSNATGYTWLDVLSASLTINPNDPASGLYVNDTVPGRLLVTWFRKLDTQLNPITVRLTIFADGRIQFGYLSVGALAFGQVSVRAPGASTFTATDFSAGPTRVAPFGDVYESFTSSDNPFDLAGGFLVFTPSAAGGYDIQYVPRP